MIDIRIEKWKDIDAHELAQFYILVRQASGRIDHEEEIPQLVKNAEEHYRKADYITEGIFAWSEGKLVGWTGLITDIPSMLILNGWGPIIHPDMDEDKIASALLQATINFAKKLERRSLRVFVDVTEDLEAEFQKYQRWYEANNLERTHIVLCMELDLSKREIELLDPPKEFTIQSIKDIDSLELRNCYLETFRNGKDSFNLSLDEKELEDFLNIWMDKSTLDEASRALVKDGQLIGFLMSRQSGDWNELGPVAIHPDFQGQGLGTVLLGAVLIQLAKGSLPCYLEVDNQNPAAIRLYEKFGFKTVSRKIGFKLKLN